MSNKAQVGDIGGEKLFVTAKFPDGSQHKICIQLKQGKNDAG